MKSILNSIALLLLSFSACMSTQNIPKEVNIAATPYPRLEKQSIDLRWINIMNNQIEEAKEARLIFLGDSITDGWRKKGASDIWKKSFSNFSPANMGMSSDGTQHVLYRLIQFNKKYPNAKPELFFLMIGTNNLGYLNHSPEETIKGTLAIVDYVVATYPKAKIIVSNITPNKGGKPNFKKELQTQMAIVDDGVKNAIIENYDSSRVILFDSKKAFLNPDKTQNANFFLDHCHLTPKGYETWSAIILPEIKKHLTQK